MMTTLESFTRKQLWLIDTFKDAQILKIVKKGRSGNFL